MYAYMLNQISLKELMKCCDSDSMHTLVLQEILMARAQKAVPLVDLTGARTGEGLASSTLANTRLMCS